MPVISMYFRYIHVNNNVQFQYSFSTDRRDLNCLGDQGDSVRPKNIMKCMKLNWNFQWGGGGGGGGGFLNSHRGGLGFFLQNVEKV